MRFAFTNLLGLLLVVGCASHGEHRDHGQRGHANAHMNQRSFEDLAAAFESKDRDAWQKPDAVVASLGDLRGQTVMDLGSGTGYFSFRLLDAGARVICADVDQRFLDLIRERMRERGVGADRMELRKVPHDSPTLKPAEADLVLVVNVYHHIESRSDYFREVRAGLEPGGSLVVVDFEKRELPVGPPVAMKMSPDAIVKELRQAGYSSFEVDRDLLPYQYIITAH